MLVFGRLDDINAGIW